MTTEFKNKRLSTMPDLTELNEGIQATIEPVLSEGVEVTSNLRPLHRKAIITSIKVKTLVYLLLSGK